MVVVVTMAGFLHKSIKLMRFSFGWYGKPYKYTHLPIQYVAARSIFVLPFYLCSWACACVYVSTFFAIFSLFRQTFSRLVFFFRFFVCGMLLLCVGEVDELNDRNTTFSCFSNDENRKKKPVLSIFHHRCVVHSFMDFKYTPDKWKSLLTGNIHKNDGFTPPL